MFAKHLLSTTFIRHYGFGTRTELPLPGEIGGIVHPLKSWSKVSIAQIPMGQVEKLDEIMKFGVISTPALVIDGEVYCGWFTTCNLSRTGAEEGFAHFTMSMLVFARYHKDEDWAAKLLNTGSLPARNGPRSGTPRKYTSSLYSTV